MQTIDFVRAGRWITAQYTEETKEVVLRGNIRLSTAAEDRRRLVAQIIRAATEIAVVSERLSADTHALAVLEAFGLEALRDREYAITLAESAAAFGATERETLRPDFLDPIHRVSGKWWILESCLAPIEKLTIPPVVMAETDYDEVLTLELRYEGELQPKAETVAEVLQHASLLYGTIARGLEQREYPPLTVIYADSGSDVRFDLAGLGEPIKELKGFLVELWRRFRHRRADDYRANAEALLGGLRAVAALEALKQQGAVNDEDLARYKRDILESGMKLFETGTLPREVPRVESVGNQKILTEFQRKLLPAPEPPATAGPKTGKTTKRRRQATPRRRG